MGDRDAMISRAHNPQSGVVLVAVLVVCMGLVAITLLFTSAAMMDYHAIQNDLAGRQAEQAVEGGARYAKMLIESVQTPGTMPDRTSYTASEMELGSGYFWIIGRAEDPTSNVTEPQWGLVDEASKLNLNNPDLTAEMLLNLPGMTQDLADAIISWRNSSSSAKSDTYSQRQPPYHRKQANFDSIAELALLEGADPAVLASRDQNLNGLVDTYENDSRASLSSMSGTSTIDGPGIWEYVTVFSRELNPPTKVLADTASPQLIALITQNLDPARAQLVISNLRSQTKITGPLDLIVKSQLTEDEYELIGAQLRFSNAPTIYPVNVNTASATVLACIPGIDSNLAQQIVSDRANHSTNSTSIAWLAKTFAGNLSAAQTAAPFLTGSTFVISADVAGVGHNGRGYRRTQFVYDHADASATTAKLIYRRNLSSAGWALGREVRNTLAQERIGG